jgi:hypothetical protein
VLSMEQKGLAAWVFRTVFIFPSLSSSLHVPMLFNENLFNLFCFLMAACKQAWVKAEQNKQTIWSGYDVFLMKCIVILLRTGPFNLTSRKSQIFLFLPWTFHKSGGIWKKCFPVRTHNYKWNFTSCATNNTFFPLGFFFLVSVMTRDIEEHGDWLAYTWFRAAWIFVQARSFSPHEGYLFFNFRFGSSIMWYCCKTS